MEQKTSADKAATAKKETHTDAEEAEEKDTSSDDGELCLSQEDWFKKMIKFKKKIKTQQEEMRRERAQELRVYSTAVRLSQ